MDIIQSFWTKPILKENNKKINLNSNAGWYNSHLHFISWSYSCLTLIKYYKKVTLYTDVIGKYLLIDLLQLPYTSVEVKLDVLNKYDNDLWALGKMYTYSIQSKPFLHVDGDIYISDKFPSRLLKKELIVQSLEYNNKLYEEIIIEAFKTLRQIPPFINKNIERNNQFRSVNAGIIGGNNVDFLIRYSKTAIDFIDNNIENLAVQKIQNINLFYEQYFLKCMSLHEGIKISCLFKNVSNEYFELTNFQLHPKENPFIHMIGFSKRNIILCEQLMIRFKLEFPLFYNKTLKILKNNSIFNSHFDLC